jgi:hypothetical protein
MMSMGDPSVTWEPYQRLGSRQADRKARLRRSVELRRDVLQLDQFAEILM